MSLAGNVLSKCGIAVSSANFDEGKRTSYENSTIERERGRREFDKEQVSFVV